MKLTKKTIEDEEVYFENGVKKYVHSKNSTGYESWKEYDKNDNVIHSKDSDGSETWREFDKNNNLIHSKNSNGFEIWREFDKNDNRIYHKDSDGYEYWSDDHPKNPKNIDVEVDIEPFKFTTEE